MSFSVLELPKAKRDKRSIFKWLHAHSPTGAASWLDAYDGTLERLSRDATMFAEASESREFEERIQQALFKTRRGRVYRALFYVEGANAYVLRVRGPGQAAVVPDDISR
jgi:hypothetical protein